MSKARYAAYLLTLSAAGLIAIATDEGYEPKAKPPLPGDKPTLGFGETKGVKAGDTTTPVRALIVLGQSADGYQRGVAKCIKVPVSQNEFDAYVNFAYQMGVSNFCNAGFTKKLNAGDYRGACEGMAHHPNGKKAWSYFQGQYVEGIYQRRLRNRAACLEGLQ
jgi:lysozyme